MYLKILILVFFIAGCTTSSSNQAMNDQSQSTIKSDKGIPIGYHNLYLKESLKREVKDNNCAEWFFPESTLRNLLKSFEEVSGMESYQRCYQYKCWYTGKVSNQKEDYEITVHAGGYIILSNEKETLHFIMTKESDLFVSVCDCCETEEEDR